MNRRFFAPTLLRAWLLAALLLAAQAAGLAHRVVHAPGAAPAVSGWSAEHEQGSADCRLIDQLAHADVLCGTFSASALPAFTAEPAAAQARISAAASPAAAYQARAPPRA